MTKPHPLSAQCTARSKRSGERCQRRVIGGGPCRMHGGAAPAVKAKREQRILVGEIAMQSDEVFTRSPGEVLVGAMHDADTVLQKIKGQALSGAQVDPALLNALGEWLDRAARVSKSVLDSGADEEITRQAQLEAQVMATEVLQAMYWPFFEAMTCMGLTPAQATAGVDVFEMLVLGLVSDEMVTPPGRPDLRAVATHAAPRPKSFDRWHEWGAEAPQNSTAQPSRALEVLR